MPLDPSIPLQVQNPTIDLASQFGKAQEMQNAQVKNQYMQKQIEGADTENQLKQLQNQSALIDYGTKLHGMATSENFPLIRQMAIKAKLGTEETIPKTYDLPWLSSIGNELEISKQKNELEKEQAMTKMYNAHAKYFDSGGGVSGGGATGANVRAYMNDPAYQKAWSQMYGGGIRNGWTIDENGEYAPTPGFNETLKSKKYSETMGTQDAKIDTGFEKSRQESLGKEAPILETGRNQVSNVLSNLRSNYNALDKLKSVVNTQNTAGQNLSASIRQSTPGQFVGKTIGTPEQSIRNKINADIPNLINSMRKATGMSAKAMDSNAELQFYLKMATDPKVDVQANLRALDNIDAMMGRSAPLPTGINGRISSQNKEAASPTVVKASDYFQ
ncbi:MAG: hypothetical protein WCR66_13855 [Bacteroidota bacterium]